MQRRFEDRSFGLRSPRQTPTLAADPLPRDRDNRHITPGLGIRGQNLEHTANRDPHLTNARLSPIFPGSMLIRSKGGLRRIELILYHVANPSVGPASRTPWCSMMNLYASLRRDRYRQQLDPHARLRGGGR